MPPTSEVWSISDIRNAASAKLDPKWAQYINEGAEDLITLKANELAYNRYRIMPRILRDVGEIDTSTNVFGAKISWPFGFSPAAMHCLAHPDGEVATARAAAKAGIAMCLSTWATKSLEEVISVSDEDDGKIPYAIQTSSGSRKDYTLELVTRAHKAGYKAVLITVDAPTVGRRFNE
jgi:(S)-2-hydroxy-acid oxidase